MTISARFACTNTTRGVRLACRAAALAALLVAAAGCAGSEPGTPAAGAAGSSTPGGATLAEGAADQLQVEQGHLAWGELRLGMTVQEAEERLGRQFGFTGTQGACPGVTAPVRLHGHAVHVTFDSDKPQGKLREATVELTGEGDLAGLLDAVRRKVPGLESVPGKEKAGSAEPEKQAAMLSLTADPEQAVLAKPDEALTITYTDCLN